MSRTVKVLIHIGYWIMYCLLILVFIAFLIGMQLQSKPVPGQRQMLFTLMIGFAVIPAIFSFYGFYSWIFPQFLATKKYLLVIVFAIIASVIAASIGAGFLQIPSVLNPNFSAKSVLFQPVIIGIMSFNALVNGVIALIIRGFISWVSERKQREEIEKKQLQTELELIKSQIDPHFLFNTLNNIDSILTTDAEKASEYIRNLSDIMRSLLYETKLPFIPLEQDIQYIEKYLSLQRIRYSNPNFVHFDVNGPIEGVMIPPMLFLPFIENAFKHGARSKIGIGINVHFSVTADQLIFTCSNQKEEITKLEGTKGIGNELSKKRIQLLYPQKNTISVNDTETSYEVKIELKHGS